MAKKKIKNSASDSTATYTEWAECYKEAISIWEKWLGEAHKDMQFYLGDQWSSATKAYLEGQKRSVMVFNKCRRVVHWLEGFERKNRLSLKIDPVGGSDENTASQFSDIVLWNMQAFDGYPILSTAFSGGPLKTGLNAIHLYMDYSDDPVSGDIRYARMPYNSFLLDPNFSLFDLSDCAYVIRRNYLSKDVTKSLLPDQAKTIEKMKPKGKDQRFTFLPYNKDMLGEERFRYDELWKYTSKSVDILIDTRTGEMMEWQGNKQQLDLLLMENPQVRSITKIGKKVEYSVYVDEVEMYKGADPSGLEDEYPIVPLIGFLDPEYEYMDWKLQGVVRCMRDPQRESNKRRSQFIDMIESQINTGWKAEEGSVVNPETLYGSGQGKVTWMKKGSLDKAIPHQAVDIPAGYFNVLQTLDKDLLEIPGINPEMLGMPENENIKIAGILAKLRQGAGLVDVQNLFDNLRYAKKLLGRKQVEMIKRNFNPQKVTRITEKPPTREFFTKQFGKYDCTPTEGLLTDSQRQMYYTQLMAWKEAGAPIPWEEILDVAPIERKEDLKKAIAKQSQMDQQQMQLQMMTALLSQGMMKSKIGLDMASAQEKKAKALELIKAAGLNEAKTINEIETSSNQQLMDIIGLVRDIIREEMTGYQPSQDNAIDITPKRRAMTRR
jgi:hypothetical protein